MAVTVLAVHDMFKKQLLDGPGWTSLTMQAMLLLRNAYTPADTDQFVSDVLGTSAVEVPVTGYARVTLTGQTTILDDPNTRAEGDADDIIFDGPPDVGGTYDTLTIFELITDDAHSPLAITFDLGGVFSTNGANITFTLDPSGLFFLS